MDKSTDSPFRICALCRHFRVLENKREFPQIADSAYLSYECAKLGWQSREDYLMDSNPAAGYLPASEEGFDCPHWEALSNEE